MNAAEFVTRLAERQSIGTGERLRCGADSTSAARCDEAGPIEDAQPVEEREINTFGLVELLLKNRRRLHQALRDQRADAIMLPRLLGIAMVGFVLFGVVMSLVLTVSGRWPTLTAISTWLEAPSTRLFSIDVIDSSWGKFEPWVRGRVLVLTGAYAFGLVAASGVALPSLYFYCLLAGIRMTMVEVVAHAVKAKAIAAVALVGILPIYVAVAMGVVIFKVDEFWIQATMLLGLVLPLIAGFWGTASLYQGFAQLCDTMPADQAASRECFLRRLVLSWTACYSAIMPVMIYSLWAVFSGN
jgi:hypothetical protein